MLGGTISANNGTTITIMGPNSMSKTVNITASTTIEVVVGTSTPATTGTTADLVVGKMALVQGMPNQDGSITAIHIRVGPLPVPGMMNNH
jgi:ribosomal protein S8E